MEILEKSHSTANTVEITYGYPLSGSANLDLELEIRFAKYREEATSFSREMQSLLNPNGEIDTAGATKINLVLAKVLFGKWSTEILAILYGLRTASYGDIKKKTRGITSRVLSQKLKTLEKAKLVHRSVINSRPPSVSYALTEKGLTIAKIAEPVFLYAAIIEGLYTRPTFLVQEKQVV